ncbi:MAG TPA: hypothetical protein DHN29_12970, partial [Cytophagales bacterium]|nr:hypothetical protein [Cytophagales bacterium]
KNIKIGGRTVGEAKALLVGEAPGESEDAANAVFVGRAGEKLQWLLDKTRVGNRYRLTNAVRCFPHGTPKITHIDACREYLTKEIKEIRPKVIVAVGGQALKSLLNLEEITKNRGFWFTYTDGDLSIPVMPTFHPASNLRPRQAGNGGWEDDEIVIRDFQEVSNVLDGMPVTEYKLPEVRVIGVDCSLGTFYNDLIKRKIISLDTEFTHLDYTRGKMICCSFGTVDKYAYVLPFFHKGGVPFWNAVGLKKAIAALKLILEDKRILKCGQAASKDICYFRMLGIEIEGYYFDTAYAQSVINENLPTNLTFMQDWYGLAFGRYDAGLDYYKKGGDKTQGNKMLELEDNVVWKYAGVDAVATMGVCSTQYRALQNEGMYESPFLSWKMPMFNLVTELEWNGIYMNKDGLDERIADISIKVDDLNDRVIEIAGNLDFNPNSTPQVAVILKRLNLLGPKPKKTKGGKIAVDKSVLTLASEMENGEFARLLIDHRHQKKMLGTYFEKVRDQLSPDGYFRDSFRGHLVETHRLSAFSHTFPREKDGIRKCFTAPPGYDMHYADYDQLEQKLIALISGDEVMLQEFREGKDVYRGLAALLHGKKYEDVSKSSPERQAAKTTALALNYCVGDSTVSKQYGFDEEYVANVRAIYFGKYKKVKQWMDWAMGFVVRHGYMELPGGLKRRFPSIEWAKWSKHRGTDRFDELGSMQRSAENSPIQAGAGYLVHVRVLALQDYLLNTEKKSRDEVRLVYDQHDAVVYYVGKKLSPWFGPTMVSMLEWKDCPYKGNVIDFTVEHKIVASLEG